LVFFLTTPVEGININLSEEVHFFEKSEILFSSVRGFSGWSPGQKLIIKTQEESKIKEEAF
jgi:hypothetical protein